MKKTTKEYIFENKDLGKYEFTIDTSTFEPTQTTVSIIHSSLPLIRSDSKVLDLGCGCGIVSIILSKLIKKNIHFFASDISESVEEIVQNNAIRHNVNIEVKRSNIFEAWSNQKFDLIINDISGVSDKVAKISPWFNNIACETGPGGDILVKRVINESTKHLKKGGKLVFPIISFSNEDEIIESANKVFTSVKLLRKDFWPTPKEMHNHLPLLNSLKQSGLISFEEKFGTIIGHTSVFEASL